MDSGEAVASGDRSDDRGGRLDRPGHRLVVPARHAARQSRRPTGAWRSARSGASGATRGRPSTRPWRTGTGRCTRSCCSVTTDLVARAHDAGLAVNVWTVNAREDLTRNGGAGRRHRDHRPAHPTHSGLQMEAPRAPRKRDDRLLARRGGSPGPFTGHSCAARKQPVTGPNGEPRPGSTKMVGHERRRLREADPRPGRPAVAQSETNTLVRVGKLILDDSDSYGVEMALQLARAGGDEVTLVSMAPDGETSGLRTGLAMGAAGHPGQRRRARRHRRPGHGQGARRGHQAGQARPGPRRRTESTDGYTGTLPVQSPSCSACPSVTFAKPSPSTALGQGAAPDRGRLRRGRLPAPRRGHGHRRRGRAPLSLLQGHHGGQLEACRQADRRRPRSRGRRWVRPGRPGDHLVSDGRGAQRARSSSTRATRREASWPSSSRSRFSRRMDVDKIWVLAETADGAGPTP